EKLELMAATTTVLAYGADQLKLPVYLARLLQHAIKLVGGDYGDIFWVIDDRNFAVVAQQGQSNIKMGDTPPSPSVARRVAESRKPVLIPDVTDKNRFPYYANCRADVRGEVAIPMLLRDFRQ